MRVTVAGFETKRELAHTMSHTHVRTRARTPLIRREVAQSCHPYLAARYQTVQRLSTRTHLFYVVVKGSLQATDSSGGTRTVVAGESVGEVAFWNGDPRRCVCALSYGILEDDVI